jgi:hypothetical protein
MDPLPFVDMHEIAIAAPPDEVWRALEDKVAGTALLGRRGFPERDAKALERLTLTGGHRFARYSLIFELSPVADGTRVRATTHAEFRPGAGRIYRAVVIGSGGHALVVRRFLKQLRTAVERRA